MEKNKSQGIVFFEKFLTIWVLLCMAMGIFIGKFLPDIPTLLNRFEFAQISIPIAILIWVMIYPMMIKVDFQAIKNVRKNPLGLIISSGTSWLIKPFLMFGLVTFFFYVVFKAFIPAALIGASDFFELSVAVAIALFGANSPVVLVCIVGVPKYLLC